METLSNKDPNMSAIAHDNLRQYAAINWPKLNHKGRLRELAKLLPWSTRRVRAVYNAEAGVSLRADEMAQIDTLTKEASDALRASQESFRTLEARIAALEAYFQFGDTEFGSEHVAALRSQTHGSGGSS